MVPRIRSRAEVASGVFGEIARVRCRRTGSGSPSSSASLKAAGSAARSNRSSNSDTGGVM